jgi:hypothetical protein
MMNMQEQTNSQVPPTVPNEAGSVGLQGHIKIFDPDTKEVFVEKRA